MLVSRRPCGWALAALIICAHASTLRAEDPKSARSVGDAVVDAMTIELDRAMKGLSIDDLPTPYHIRMKAEDRKLVQVDASLGGVTQSSENHTRTITTRVRVGDFELDNTNFGPPFGNAAYLPLGNDLIALRHAIWLALDTDYKRAVEVFAAKQAYLAQVTIEDRPDDYTKAEPVVSLGEWVHTDVNRDEWEEKIARISGRFAQHPEIQLSSASFLAGVANEVIVTSEGTRIRDGDDGAIIRVQAELQAEDGMRIADGRTYIAETLGELPSVEKIEKDIDELCKALIAQAGGEALDHYTGPVLFTDSASGSTLLSLLGDNFAARPPQVAARRQVDDSFEKKLGRRILPRSFSVVDDPTMERYDGKPLLGHIRFDDEGTKPRRVTLVEDGKLEALVAGRAPTRKVVGTTGHARSSGFADPEASVSNLIFKDEDGLPTEELETELIEAAKDEGLDFALKVSSLNPGRGEAIGAPVIAHKIYAEDGRTEPVRGLVFERVEVRSLKRLLAAGDEPSIYNSLGQQGVSVIAPPILFEELELNKPSEEFDKKPYLPSPANRKP